jgi:hypothetical protein
MTHPATSAPITSALFTALAATLLAAPPARAHDTWFDPRPDGLWIGTGDHYPKQEFTLAARSLARHACVAADGRASPLKPLQETPTALRLAAAPATATTCWAQLLEFEVAIEPKVVQIYFDEIQAGPDLRQAWAGQQARGVPFQERYVKHLRVHLRGAPAREPAMDLDALIETADPQAPFAARAGDELSFRIYRHGRPLAGFAAQFRSELSPVGLWRRSDAEGRIRVQLPLAGRWMLRGTELRQVDSERGLWRSRFVTLVFDLAPKAPAAAPPATARGS